MALESRQPLSASSSPLARSKSADITENSDVPEHPGSSCEPGVWPCCATVLSMRVCATMTPLSHDWQPYNSVP